MSGAFQASCRGSTAAPAAPGAESARGHIHHGPGEGQRGAAAVGKEVSPHRPAVSPTHTYATQERLDQNYFKCKIKAIRINQDLTKQVM